MSVKIDFPVNKIMLAALQKMSHFSDFLTWSHYHIYQSISLFSNFNIGYAPLSMEKLILFTYIFDTFRGLKIFLERFILPLLGGGGKMNRTIRGIKEWKYASKSTDSSTFIARYTSMLFSAKLKTKFRS